MAAHRRLGRDRHQIHYTMQLAINERATASWAKTSPTWDEATDRAAEIRAQHLAWHEVRRALWGIDNLKRMHFAARHEHYLRLHRYVRWSRRIRQARAALTAFVRG